jgi:hypothetical protein
MAKKSAPQKKTPAAKVATSRTAKSAPKKSAAKPSAAKSAASNGPATGGCYVSVSQVAVTISPAKGKAGGAACDGFEAAKNAAIDGLIESIEAAEAQLAACKRAATIEELKTS